MYSFAAIFMRVRAVILNREADTTWVKELIRKENR
jgi:heme exporter protein C